MPYDRLCKGRGPPHTNQAGLASTVTQPKEQRLPRHDTISVFEDWLRHPTRPEPEADQLFAYHCAEPLWVGIQPFPCPPHGELVAQVAPGRSAYCRGCHKWFWRRSRG